MKYLALNNIKNQRRVEAMNEEKVYSARKMLSNQKGLTLIELLAVIVILGIIAAIAVPAVGSLINRTEDRTHRANAHLIIDAARLMVTNEGFKATDAVANANLEKITLTTLAGNGYLNTIPEDPEGTGTYSASTSFVSVTRTIADKDTINERETFTYSIFLDSAGTDIGTADAPVLESNLDSTP